MCIYEQQLIFGYNVVAILYKPTSCRTFASEMRRKMEVTDTKSTHISYINLLLTIQTSRVMKKLFALVAAVIVSTVSAFAQYYTTYEPVIVTSTRSSVSANSDIFSNLNTYSYSTNTNVVYQEGYTRSNGTYVKGHYKTKRNDTNWDNFSTSGNINIYTGTSGSVARDYTVDAYNYGSGRTIHTGSRGGQYYINSNGNKTYVPKRSTTYTW